MTSPHWSVSRVLAISIASAMLLAACSTSATTGAGANRRSANLAKSTIAASVSATGNVAPEAEVKLSFQVSGTVADVKVKAGDKVNKGDVLATLDLTDLQIAQQQAEATMSGADAAIATANIAIAVANAGYSRTVDGARQSDVDSASASVNSAYQNYVKVKQGPHAEDYAGAVAAFKNTEAQLKQAQAAYDRQYSVSPGGIGASPQSLALEQATNAWNQAKAALDKATKPSDSAALASAVNQLQAARAQLDKAKTPARQFDIDQAVAQQQQAAAGVKQAQIQKQQAELTLKQAKRRIDQAVLLAPVSGLVKEINIKIGEQAGLAPVTTLVDNSLLHIDVTVDEIDISRVKLGQDVNVTLDALPGRVFAAKVDRVAPTSHLVNGVVSYDVRVLLPNNDPDLRVGMTSSAAITLDRRENVLAVPNWAVRRDRKAGKNFVTLKEGDKTREVEIQVGLRNDQFTELLSGATEGQTVVAPDVPNALGG